MSPRPLHSPLLCSHGSRHALASTLGPPPPKTRFPQRQGHEGRREEPHSTKDTMNHGHRMFHAPAWNRQACGCAHGSRKQPCSRDNVKDRGLNPACDRSLVRGPNRCGRGFASFTAPRLGARFASASHSLGIMGPSDHLNPRYTLYVHEARQRLRPRWGVERPTLGAACFFAPCPLDDWLRGAVQPAPGSGRAKCKGI